MSDSHTLEPMPNKPKTTLRNFRIPDDEYERAKRKADRDPAHGNLSSVVRELLRAYVESDLGEE